MLKLPALLSLVPLKIARFALCRVFGLERWHMSVLSERPYAQDVIRYLNALDAARRNTVVEIGCGLGEIVRHLRFREARGLDRSGNAVRAARILPRYYRNASVSFGEFVFPEDRLEGSYDVIILVNWVNWIAPAVLKEYVEKYFNGNLRPGGSLLIDTVQDKTYINNHDIAYLTKELRCSVVKIGEYEHGREVFALVKPDTAAA